MSLELELIYVFLNIEVISDKEIVFNYNAIECRYDNIYAILDTPLNRI